MTNEEVYKVVEEEKRKKEEINNKWNNTICPVCGEKHFKAGYTYSLLDMGKFMDVLKGRHTSGMSYQVVPYVCQKCDCVILRKVK